MYYSDGKQGSLANSYLRHIFLSSGLFKKEVGWHVTFIIHACPTMCEQSQLFINGLMNFWLLFLVSKILDNNLIL